MGEYKTLINNTPSEFYITITIQRFKAELIETTVNIKLFNVISICLPFKLKLWIEQSVSMPYKTNSEQ